MPKPTTKKRQELRSLFLRNAIPTEEDYADLIAAGLNQADDGLLKLPDQPLGLVRQKPPASVPPSTGPSTPSTASAPAPSGVLNFFGAPEDDSPSWQMQLIGTNRPGFALADQDGTSRLFLDGTTGNLGVGTTTPAQRLTVEGPWGPGKDSANTLDNVGQLAIKGTKAQLDFVDSDRNHTDWAIHVDDNKMSFVRSPWHNKDLVLDGKGNVGIGIETPDFKLDVNGDMRVQGRLFRSISYATGNGPYSEQQPPGQIPSRVLTITKKLAANQSVLRILYSDNFRLNGNDASARWEIRVKDTKSNDLIALNPRIISDRFHQYHNHCIPGMIMGYASKLPASTYEIQVWVLALLKTEPTNALTGFNFCTWCLEAEEILIP